MKSLINKRVLEGQQTIWQLGVAYNDEPVFDADKNAEALMSLPEVEDEQVEEALINLHSMCMTDDSLDLLIECNTKEDYLALYDLVCQKPIDYDISLRKKLHSWDGRVIERDSVILLN